MTVEEYNRAVDTYADNLYRFVLKNLKDDAYVERYCSGDLRKVVGEAGRWYPL